MCKPNSQEGTCVQNDRQQSKSFPNSIHLLVEQLAQLGFQQNLRLKRKALHFPFIHQLTQFLLFNGYNVKNEYPLRFFSLPRRQSRNHPPKPTGWTDGQIDIMAFKGTQRLAIEFDTTTHLKWKSIEKLFHSSASHAVGMIFGSWKEAGETFRSNVWRIKTVADEMRRLQNCDLSTSEFWLILLKSKYIQQIMH